MKPLLSYYGGKQRIVSKILPWINSIDHTVYVEPFCGGATCFFAKPQPNPNNFHDYREVLNDYDDRIINLYRVVQTQFDAFNHLIQYTPYSEAEHKKSKLILKHPDDYEDLWKAWAIYTNISQSFSKTLDRGWSRSATTQNRAFTWNNHKMRLSAIFERLKHTFLSSCDAIKCINDWDSPTTLFYCDPPYPDADQGHYKGYTQDDFESLIDTLSQCQGSFILSCYPNQAVPSDWQKIEIEAICSASKGKRTPRTECLWICDRTSSLNSLPLFATL